MKGKTGLPKKYRQLSATEALETAKQRLTALATRLKRYSSEVEAKRINRMFSDNPAKVCSQWQGGENTEDPPRAESEQYWKSIWEKEVSHNTNTQWLVELQAEHGSLHRKTQL